MSVIVHSLRPLAKTTKATLPTVQALRMTLDCLELSQARLARRIKSTARTVGKWCSGQTPVSVESLSNDDEIGMTFGRCLTVVMAERFGKKRRVA